MALGVNSLLFSKLFVIFPRGYLFVNISRNLKFTHDLTSTYQNYFLLKIAFNVY